MATAGLGGIDFGNMTAGADLSGSQYRFVALGTTAYQVVGSSTASAPVALGVLQNDPKSGEAATVRVIGATKVEAGGVIGVRDFISINASGQAMVTSSTCPIYGMALEASTAQGQRIGAFLLPLSACTLGDNTP